MALTKEKIEQLQKYLGNMLDPKEAADFELEILRDEALSDAYNFMEKERSFLNRVSRVREVGEQHAQPVTETPVRKLSRIRSQWLYAAAVLLPVLIGFGGYFKYQSDIAGMEGIHSVYAQTMGAGDESVCSEGQTTEACIHFLEGRKALKNKEYDRAVTSLTEALELAGDDMLVEQSAFFLSAAHLLNGNPEEAIRILDGRKRWTHPYAVKMLREKAENWWW